MLGEDESYEIVFGHRRHQACLELGLPVLAVIEDVDDTQLFAEMDRENRERKDLRPYEVGCMYAKALDLGLFPSARKMSEAIGADLGLIGKAMNLAKLPQVVVDAFTSPTELQYRWAAPLNAALQRDPDGVLTRAKRLSKREPRLSAKLVFDELTAADTSTKPGSSDSIRKVKVGSRSATLKWIASEKTIQIDLPGASQDELQQLEVAVIAFLKGG